VTDIKRRKGLGGSLLILFTAIFLPKTGRCSSCTVKLCGLHCVSLLYSFSLVLWRVSRCAALSAVACCLSWRGRFRALACPRPGVATTVGPEWGSQQTFSGGNKTAGERSHRPEHGGNNQLRNMGQFTPDSMADHPGRPSCWVRASQRWAVVPCTPLPKLCAGCALLLPYLFHPTAFHPSIFSSAGLYQLFRRSAGSVNGSVRTRVLPKWPHTLAGIAAVCSTARTVLGCKWR
jgi:hypothetical protein